MNRLWIGILCVCSGLTLLGVGPFVAAQEKDKPPVEAEFAVWNTKSLAQPLAAAQVVGMGTQPYTAYSLRASGHQYVTWDEVGFAESFAPALNPKFLEDIKDGRWPPSLLARPKREVPREDLGLINAFSEAMIKSFETPFDAFKKSAEENKHVTYAHLMSTPDLYRGQVIPIKGRMVMLRRIPPMLSVKENSAVKDVYVGWVFGPTRHANPFCVHFPILPAGLEPSEEMKQEVTFYGYFLATFKYEAKDGPKVTPFMVGPTVVLGGEKEAAPATMDSPVVTLIQVGIGFLLFLSIVFFLMHMWAHRADRRVFSTLDQIKNKHLSSPFANEDETLKADQDDAASNPVPAQLILGHPPASRLPEAKPIDPERN